MVFKYSTFTPKKGSFTPCFNNIFLMPSSPFACNSVMISGTVIVILFHHHKFRTNRFKSYQYLIEKVRNGNPKASVLRNCYAYYLTALYFEPANASISDTNCPGVSL